MKPDFCRAICDTADAEGRAAGRGTITTEILDAPRFY
jgi:hypothetical protein